MKHYPNKPAQALTPTQVKLLFWLSRRGVVYWNDNEGCGYYPRGTRKKTWVALLRKGYIKVVNGLVYPSDGMVSVW